ncbi:hypothetical protein ES703_00756 [subsurface metagenome]
MESFYYAGVRRGSFLHKLLESWADTLCKYEEIMYPSDLPYLYRERTNVGFLASAATKLGALVLEEFSCNKKRGRKQRPGRADLWIWAGGKAPDYQFEAKYISPNARTKPLESEIKEALKEATKDICKIPMHDRAEDWVGIGIVFVVPYFPRRREFSSNQLRNRLLHISSLNADFCAIHFCQGELQATTPHCFPCVAIVGKYVKCP